MTRCPDCSAAAHPNAQCPYCGAFVLGDDDGGLEIDTAEPRHRATAGVVTPTAAQIGGADGGAAMVLSRSEAPVAAKPDVRTFAERERSSRRQLWYLTRVPLLIILGWFTLSHLVLDSDWVFIDHVNLVIHEAGHVFFSWGGDTLHFLGGTLGQLMMPAVFAAYFYWWRSERFSAVACVWWFGENFIGIARYMADAAARALPLVGGGIHDWGHLFTKWDVLSETHEIAKVVRYIGVVTMLVSLGLLVYWTFRPTTRELDHSLAAQD